MYPDAVKNANLYTALVHELVAIGHEVRVIAPCHDADSHVSVEAGVAVLRVRSGPLFNTGLIKKGVHTVLLNNRYKRAIRRFWPDWHMDWLLASTPPITLSPFLKTLKNRHQAGVYLILRDIFPQNAKDLGMIRDPFLFAYFRARERHLYGISDLIGCMSPGNIAFLRAQDSDIFKSDKLRYFPNWIKPTPKEKHSSGNFRKRFELERKFIALFGGNFGKPQKTEFVLELAETVRNLAGVVFFLIGDGTEINEVRRMVVQKGLSNVLVLDRLPMDEYQSLIHEADIGLVNLSDKFTIPNIPSRTLGYWDASLPVLAATDSSTDLNESFLKKHNAGLWARTGDIEGYYAQFMKLYQDPQLRRTMGENGRKAVETEYSAETAAKRLIEQIAEHGIRRAPLCHQ